MYSFNIKDNSPDINIVLTRCMLALAAIACLLYQGDHHFYIHIIAAVTLFIAAVFANFLLVRYKIDPRILLCIAAVLLFAATRSIAFAVILIVYGLLIKKLHKNPIVHVNTEGVMFKKMFSNPLYAWGEFNNIILKDDLLTLDFRDNRLLQLNIIEGENEIDESSFNNFCSKFIGV